MSNISRKIRKNINDSELGNYITKEELENYKKRIYELKALILDSTKKKEFALMKKYSQELVSITKKLKKERKRLKKKERK